MDNKIIGLDFSLNSPGICVLDKGSAKWISIYRTSNIIEKLFQKDGSPFRILPSESINIKAIPKKEFTGEYYERERDKIINAIYFSDLVIETIWEHLESGTIVGMEGLSFGSSGNSLIDISMTTALVRSKLVSKIDPNNLYVISPTTIKKFALKGNSKKDELYNCLIEKRKSDTRLTPLLEPLENNKSKWIKSGGKVETPCSDLIDATWIALFIEENIEKLSKGQQI